MKVWTKCADESGRRREAGKLVFSRESLIFPALFSSRQQNFSVSLRLPAQLLLGGQREWLGPPVLQQQLPAGPRRLLRGGRSDPAIPLQSPGTTEPRLPGEPQLLQPSSTGLDYQFLFGFFFLRGGTRGTRSLYLMAVA